MALFTMSGVLRGFPSAEYDLYASTKTLVRPCSSEKLLIYELETCPVPNAYNAICGWALFSFMWSFSEQCSNGSGVRALWVYKEEEIQGVESKEES